MSAAKTYLTDTSPTWLQPVSYDLDGFRQFSRQLDGRLAELEKQYATGHCTPITRPQVAPSQDAPSSASNQQCNADLKGESQLPSA